MAKKRVHELAKEFKIESKEMIRRLSLLGITVKSHASTVDEKDEERLREEFEKEKTVKAQVEPKPSTSDTAKTDPGADRKLRDSKFASSPRFGRPGSFKAAGPAFSGAPVFKRRYLALKGRPAAGANPPRRRQKNLKRRKELFPDRFRSRCVSGLLKNPLRDIPRVLKSSRVVLQGVKPKGEQELREALAQAPVVPPQAPAAPFGMERYCLLPN